MGLKDRLKETKTRMMIGALVNMLSSYLTNPSAIRLGYLYVHDGWQGYVRNVKVTFE